MPNMRTKMLKANINIPFGINIKSGLPSWLNRFEQMIRHNKLEICNKL
jgi:hypothetical protein